MEIYPLDIVIHTINIVIFYLILRLLLFKPIRKFMSQREQRIQSQMDEAERMGCALAEDMLGRGADRILAELYEGEEEKA